MFLRENLHRFPKLHIVRTNFSLCLDFFATICYVRETDGHRVIAIEVRQPPSRTNFASFPTPFFVLDNPVGLCYT